MLESIETFKGVAMDRQWTTGQVARALGVSEASIKRWCDSGVIACGRTAGGHRRVPWQGVIQFVRESGQRLLRPEALGMPEGIGRGRGVAGRAAGQVAEALERGEFERLRRIGWGLYLGGHPAREIFDDVLAPAFCAIGGRWQHGEIEVYQERRACEMCMRFLRELLRAIPPPPEEAPYAIGGTLAGDEYTLGAHMAEIVLREAGWRAECYGLGLPAATWCAAMEKTKPRLVWLSVSWVESVPTFVEEARMLCGCAEQYGVALMVGGRALSERIRQQFPYSAYGDNFQHLAAFAGTLWRPREGDVRGGFAKAAGSGDAGLEG